MYAIARVGSRINLGGARTTTLTIQIEYLRTDEAVSREVPEGIGTRARAVNDEGSSVG